MSASLSAAPPYREINQSSESNSNAETDSTHYLTPVAILEDGNANEEAEVLIPSPNFYVLRVCSKDSK